MCGHRDGVGSGALGNGNLNVFGAVAETLLFLGLNFFSDAIEERGELVSCCG